MERTATISPGMALRRISDPSVFDMPTRKASTIRTGIAASGTAIRVVEVVLRSWNTRGLKMFQGIEDAPDFHAPLVFIP